MIEILAVFSQIFSMVDNSIDPSSKPSDEFDQTAEDIAYAKNCPRDPRRGDWDEWEYHLPNRPKKSNIPCKEELPFKDTM